MDTKLLKAATNPDIIWEAIGPDGVQYPFPTNTIAMSDEQRAETKRLMAMHDDNLALQISLAIITENKSALMDLMRPNFMAYIKHVSEMED